MTIGKPENERLQSHRKDSPNALFYQHCSDFIELNKSAFEIACYNIHRSFASNTLGDFMKPQRSPRDLRDKREPVEIDISMRGYVISWLKDREQDHKRWS